MKAKIYREVKASERLPNKTGRYFAHFNDDKMGSIDYILHQKGIQRNIEDKTWLREADYWLEEVEEWSPPLNSDIKDYIGESVYDGAGQIIFRGADKNDLKQFLDVRGWGAIQYMGFKTTEVAEAFQDKVGKWVSDVINNALEQRTPKDIRL